MDRSVDIDSTLSPLQWAEVSAPESEPLRRYGSKRHPAIEPP